MAHPSTDGLERKLDLIREDGTAGAMCLWNGGNVMKSEILMERYKDVSRGIFRHVLANRKFAVAQPYTQHTFEESGKGLSEVAAVVFINGTFTAGRQADEYFAAQDSSQSVSGTIGKIFMESLEDGSVGGCFLFSSWESMESYLESSAWQRARQELGHVAVEKYRATDATVSAAA